MPTLVLALVGLTLLAIGLAGPGAPIRRLRDAIAYAVLKAALFVVVTAHMVTLAPRCGRRGRLPSRIPGASLRWERHVADALGLAREAVASDFAEWEAEISDEETAA